jgi:hypothetical protein
MKKNASTFSFLLALMVTILPLFAGAQQLITPSLKQHRKALSEKTDRLLNKAIFEMQTHQENQSEQPRFNTLQLDSTVTFYGYTESNLADSTALFKTVYTYPETNVKIEVNSEMSTDEWIPGTRITSVYDEQDRLVEVFAQSYDTLTGELIPDSKLETFYHGNSASLIDSFKVSQWSPDSMDWVVQLSSRNVYDNQNKILESYSSIGFLGEPILFKDVYFYDTNGDNLLIESSAIFEGEELPSGRTENTFSNHLLTASVIFASDGINFFPESRETFLYAPFGIISRHSIMAWSAEIENWQLAITTDYDYDEEQRLSSKFITYYSEGVPADGERPTYLYVEGNNLAVEVNFLFDEANETWSLDSKKYYYYNGLTSIPNEPVNVIALSLSPNPTNGLVKIGLAETLNVHLFDGTGRLIASQELESGQEMDLSSFPSGIYQIVAQNEKRIYNGRIIKM